MFVYQRRHKKITVSATKGTITQVYMNDMSLQSLRHRLSWGGICQNQMDSHISEYLWSQDCENRGVDPFQELIEDSKTLYHVQ